MRAADPQGLVATQVGQTEAFAGALDKVRGRERLGRSTQGVIVFNTAEDEKVVSVERIGEEGEDGG